MGFIDPHLLSEGISFNDIINEYPALKEDDIKAAIAYGAERIILDH